MVTPTAPSRDELYRILDGVLDPEVPVLSVVELGIVRDVDVDDDGVVVTITPTYSGCPAMQVIERDIVSALEAHGIQSPRIRTVFSPPWTTDWMGPEAREKLRAYGIAPPGGGARQAEDDLVPLLRRHAAGDLSPEPAPECPFCGSRHTELRSAFGSTACKALAWCSDCRQPFETFKAI